MDRKGKLLSVLRLTAGFAMTAAACLLIRPVTADAEPRVPFRNPYYGNREYQDYLWSLNYLDEKLRDDLNDKNHGRQTHFDDLVSENVIELNKGETADVEQGLPDKVRENRHITSVKVRPMAVYTDGTTEPIKVSGTSITAVTPMKTAVAATINYKAKRVTTGKAFVLDKSGGRKKYVRKEIEYTSYVPRSVTYIVKVTSCAEDDPGYEPWGLGDKRAVWANGWEKRMSKSVYSQLSYIEFLRTGNDADYMHINEPGLTEIQKEARALVRSGSLFTDIDSEYLYKYGGDNGNDISLDDLERYRRYVGNGSDVERCARACDLICRELDFRNPNLTAECDTCPVVCWGYASITDKILSSLDIPCVCVGDPYGAHAWNRVRLGGKWYGLDNTWNDPYSVEKLSDGRILARIQTPGGSGKPYKYAETGTGIFDDFTKFKSLNLYVTSDDNFHANDDYFGNGLYNFLFTNYPGPYYPGITELPEVTDTLSDEIIRWDGSHNWGPKTAYDGLF